MTQTPPKTKSPDIIVWINRLAEESWHAELIISGIALYGSLQLPGLIQRFTDWSLVHFSVENLDFLLFLIGYLFIASQILIMGFISHFILRVLWISLLGFSAVYPEGIGPIKGYSEDFNDKLKKEFPDISLFAYRLDKNGKLIFGLVTAMAVFILSLVFLPSVILLIANLIDPLIPFLTVKQIFWILGLSFFIPALLPSLVNIKWLKDLAIVKKYQFPIFRLTSKITFTIFYRPINFVVYTLYSRVKRTYVIPMYIALMVLVMFGMMLAMFTSNILYFDSERLFSESSRTDRVHPSCYEDQRETGELILFGNIPSQILSESYLRVFVPIYRLEENGIDHHCGEFQEDENLSRSEKRIQKGLHRLQCLEQHLQFEMDGSPAEPISFNRFEHPDTGQKGAVAHLDIEKLPRGEHVLKVMKKWTIRDSIAWEIRIPFLTEVPAAFEEAEPEMDPAPDQNL